MTTKQGITNHSELQSLNNSAFKNNPYKDINLKRYEALGETEAGLVEDLDSAGDLTQANIVQRNAYHSSK